MIEAVEPLVALLHVNFILVAKLQIRALTPLAPSVGDPHC